MCDLSSINIRDLTDPSAIDKLYALACEEDEKAQTRLDEWHSDDVDRVLRQMDGLGRAQLQPLEQSLASIRDGLSGPRKSAATISGSIHGVVSVRSRVESTASRIEEIIDIKNCMRTVRQAIDAGSYETAASSIFKYLQLDDAVLDSQSRTLLRAAQQEMKGIVNTKLDQLTGRRSSVGSRRAAAAAAAGGMAHSTSSEAATDTLLPQPLSPALSPVSLPPSENSSDASPGQSEDEGGVVSAVNEDEVVEDEEEREKLLRKYCRMCYQLGAEEEGLARYTGHLRLACARKAEGIIRELNKYMATQERDGDGVLLPSQQLGGAEGSGKVVSYVDALTKICENVADTAQSQLGDGSADAPLWPGSIFPVLNALQVQCDIDGCRVLDMFLDRFSVAQRIAEINQSRRSSLDVHADPRCLPPIIEEISFLCQTISVFSKFLGARERDARAALLEYKNSLEQSHSSQQQQQQQEEEEEEEEDEGEGYPQEEQQEAEEDDDNKGAGAGTGTDKKKMNRRRWCRRRKSRIDSKARLQLPKSALAVLDCKKPSMLPVGELTKRAQELLGSYNTLEEYYLSESVKTILRTEDMSTETIDTIFYVAQSSLARSLFTCSTNCVCSALNVFVESVAMKLHEAILRGLRGGYTQQASSSSSSSSSTSTSPVPSQSPRSFMDWINDSQQQQQQQMQQQQQQQAQRQKVPTTWVLMNCLEQCAANMTRIRDFVKKEAERLFKGADDSEMAKIVSCSEDIAALEKRFRMTLAEVVDQVGRQQASPRVRGYVETALAARPTYELSQGDYAQLEATDSAFLQLGLSVAQLSGQYRALLSATNYESVLGLIAGTLAEGLEAGITRKRFTQLGVLQLDRDLRTLQAQLTPLNPRLVREKLARLSQVVLFLGVDRVEEAAELWCESAGRTTWRLAPAEVKKVLLLRVDFTRDRVSRIKLN